MTIASCPQCALFSKRIAALELDNEQLRVERDFFKKQCAHEEREKKRSAHPFRKNDDQLQDGPHKTPGRPDILRADHFQRRPIEDDHAL